MRAMRISGILLFVLAFLATCLAPGLAAAVDQPTGRWYVRAYNVDEQSKIVVNGKQVTKLVGFKGDSGWVDVTSYVNAKGLDTSVRCWAYNKGGGYTWGYQLGRKLPGASGVSTVWQQSAGTVGSKGANNNDQSKKNRVVFDKTYRLGTMLGLDAGGASGKWYVRAYNVDEQSKIVVNGKQVTKLVGFKGDSGWVDVTSYVNAKGLDTSVRCWAYNKGGGYTWGYQLGRKLPGASGVSTVWQQSAGTVGSKGANNNDQSKKNRVVFDKTYRLGTMRGWNPVSLPVQAPASGDSRYFAGNPFYTSGWGLPNCTCYAWGRSYVLRGTPLPAGPSGYEFRGNAKDWWATTLPKGPTPIPGAIAVWSGAAGPNQYAGHVAVVESIVGGDVYISESSYGGFYFRSTKTVADITSYGGCGTLLGYIYAW